VFFGEFEHGAILWHPPGSRVAGLSSSVAVRLDVGVKANMRAILLLREKLILGEDRFADIVIWQVPAPGSPHRYKYRLAFVVDEVCVLRFDNEAGKGDHHHMGEREMPYRFVSLQQLVDDFWDAVRRWRSQ
jgi:hypothetical protein